MLLIDEKNLIKSKLFKRYLLIKNTIKLLIKKTVKNAIKILTKTMEIVILACY